MARAPPPHTPPEACRKAVGNGGSGRGSGAGDVCICGGGGPHQHTSRSGHIQTIMCGCASVCDESGDGLHNHQKKKRICNGKKIITKNNILSNYNAMFHWIYCFYFDYTKNSNMKRGKSENCMAWAQNSKKKTGNQTARVRGERYWAMFCPGR